MAEYEYNCALERNDRMEVEHHPSNVYTFIVFCSYDKRDDLVHELGFTREGFLSFVDDMIALRDHINEERS